jgi:hypothetical protein
MVQKRSSWSGFVKMLLGEKSAGPTLDPGSNSINKGNTVNLPQLGGDKRNSEVSKRERTLTPRSIEGAL